MEQATRSLNTLQDPTQDAKSHRGGMQKPIKMQNPFKTQNLNIFDHRREEQHRESFDEVAVKWRACQRWCQGQTSIGEDQITCLRNPSSSTQSCDWTVTKVLPRSSSEDINSLCADSANTGAIESVDTPPRTWGLASHLGLTS